MAIPRTAASRAAALLIGTALAVFEPWLGLLVGIAATLPPVGWDRDQRSTPASTAEAPLTGFDT